MLIGLYSLVYGPIAVFFMFNIVFVLLFPLLNLWGECLIFCCMIVAEIKVIACYHKWHAVKYCYIWAFGSVACIIHCWFLVNCLTVQIYLESTRVRGFNQYAIIGTPASQTLLVEIAIFLGLRMPCPTNSVFLVLCTVFKSERQSGPYWPFSPDLSLLQLNALESHDIGLNREASQLNWKYF